MRTPSELDIRWKTTQRLTGIVKLVNIDEDLPTKRKMCRTRTWQTNAAENKKTEDIHNWGKTFNLLQICAHSTNHSRNTRSRSFKKWRVIEYCSWLIPYYTNKDWMILWYLFYGKINNLIWLNSILLQCMFFFGTQFSNSIIKKISTKTTEPLLKSRGKSKTSNQTFNRLLEITSLCRCLPSSIILRRRFLKFPTIFWGIHVGMKAISSDIDHQSWSTWMVSAEFSFGFRELSLVLKAPMKVGMISC